MIEGREKAILDFLSRDDFGGGAYTPLTTIAEKVPKTGNWHSYFFARDSKEEFRAFLDEMVAEGLLEARKSSPEYEPSYRATDHGVYANSFENPEFVPIAAAGHPPTSVDSRSWTGKRFVYLDENVIIEIRKEAKRLREKVYATRFESNSDSQDLKGLCDALVAICDMAEPEISIVERILNHPKFKLSAALIAAVATIRGALGT